MGAVSLSVNTSYLGLQMGMSLGLAMDPGKQPKRSWKVPLGFGVVRAKVSRSPLLRLEEPRSAERDRQRPERALAFGVSVGVAVAPAWKGKMWKLDLTCTVPDLGLAGSPSVEQSPLLSPATEGVHWDWIDLSFGSFDHCDLFTVFHSYAFLWCL